MILLSWSLVFRMYDATFVTGKEVGFRYGPVGQLLVEVEVEEPREAAAAGGSLPPNDVRPRGGAWAQYLLYKHYFLRTLQKRCFHNVNDRCVC